MKTWKNSPQKLLRIHNQFFSVLAWLPNRNLICSPCRLSTISLVITVINWKSNFVFVLNLENMKKKWNSKVRNFIKIAEFISYTSPNGPICPPKKRYKVYLSFYTTWDIQLCVCLRCWTIRHGILAIKDKQHISPRSPHTFN